MSIAFTSYESPASSCMRLMEFVMDQRPHLFRRPLKANGIAIQTPVKQAFRLHGEKKKADAIALAQANYCCAQIGAKLGVSKHTVRWWVESAGLSPPRLEYSQETKDLAVSMAKQGKPNAQIARALGVAPSTSWKWTKHITEERL